MLSRRTFSLGLLAGLTAACSGGTAGQARPMVAGGWWPIWRDRFVDPSGRVIDTGNGGISHSEGQGYGMVMAAIANDDEAFARMAEWTEGTLGRLDVALHSWRFDPREANPVSDPNNATDGDLLIAWGLQIAAERTGKGAYRDRASAIRSAILSRCTVERHGRRVLLPGMAGFVGDAEVTFNPSYYIWPALDVARRAEAGMRGGWERLIADGESLVRQCRFGPAQLPVDWAALTAQDRVVVAKDRPPRFGFDAIRVPLYALMGHRADLAAPVAAFWRERLEQGRMISAWVDVLSGEEANFAISAGGAAILALLLGQPQPTQLAADYYSAALQMLTRAAGQGGI